jgi:UDP-N-acetylglucosamine/UDP-N-acetylgalactosamine diphosphorylase
MDVKPRSHQKLVQLIEQGVDIPNPATIDIGDDVNIDRICGKGVKIYPGCRIYGSKTIISPGCRLGYEAPVTIEDCQLGAGAELKGGFFSKSVFLEKANLGMGAHVREGCILEEEAGGAHCVGLKQTILFPFVTLGSLINFCDCLMAGGTSRSNHSEVGSSYIHFNFTPDADKTTPSLIGDVPRGVMLNQSPIFLGGQGGIIGPVRLGFGNVVAAGSILRHDYPQDNQLIFEKTPVSSVKSFQPATYPRLDRIIENNILYLGNIIALEEWYQNVRKPFLEAQPLGNYLFAGAMEQLSSAKKERLKRLKSMTDKAYAQTVEEVSLDCDCANGRRELHEQMEHLEGLFSGNVPNGLEAVQKSCDVFLNDFEKYTGKDRGNYIKTIQGLPPEVSQKGTTWLNGILYALCDRVVQALPSMALFRKTY